MKSITIKSNDYNINISSISPIKLNIPADSDYFNISLNEKNIKIRDKRNKKEIKSIQNSKYYSNNSHSYYIDDYKCPSCGFNYSPHLPSPHLSPLTHKKEYKISSNHINPYQNTRSIYNNYSPNKYNNHKSSSFKNITRPSIIYDDINSLKFTNNDLYIPNNYVDNNDDYSESEISYKSSLSDNEKDNKKNVSVNINSNGNIYDLKEINDGNESDNSYDIVVTPNDKNNTKININYSTNNNDEDSFKEPDAIYTNVLYIYLDI